MTQRAVKRPTHISWYGEVPSHWKQMRLKDAVDGCVNGFWGDEGLGDGLDTQVIRVADFHRNERRVAAGPTFRSIKPEQRSGRALEPGDLLIEKSGGGELQPVGMVVQYEGEAGAVCSNFVARMRPREGVVGRYLCLLHAHLYERSVTTLSIKQSTGIQNLDSAAYLGETCFLPPPDEQVAIASYLDVETARIDALIAEKQGLLSALEQLKSARITQVLTGAERPLIHTGNEWLPKIPQGWSLVRLKFLGQVRSGIAKGKRYEGTPMVEVPYLRVANVQDGYLDLSTVSLIEVSGDEAERYALKPWDVLMNEGGDYDKVGRGAMWSGEVSPCIHQNHVFAVRLDDVTIAPWLAAITRTAYAKFYFMNNAKQSTNLASISQGNVKEFPVVLPPQAERGPLLQRLNEELLRFSDLAEHAREEMSLLAELRSTTITDAILGRIDVRPIVQNKKELEAA